MGFLDILKRYGILVLGVIFATIGVGLAIWGFIKDGHKNVTGTSTAETGVSVTGTKVSLLWQMVFWGGLLLTGLGVGMVVGGLVLWVSLKPAVVVTSRRGTRNGNGNEIELN